jgi:two-component system sensor histidine kinase UhpB
LINALRHGQPSSVDISVQAEANADRIVVTVQDDGVGMPSDWSRPGHFGLRGLAERVERLGGTFSVGNSPTRGVRLMATVPLAVSR